MNIENAKEHIAELEDNLLKLQSLGLDNEIVNSTVYACIKELQKLKAELDI